MDDWVLQLSRNGPDAAWDALLSRYRRLIFAAIRHYAGDHDDVMDIFVHVCEGLRADDLKRVRSFVERAERGARFSTWLVTVVRHMTVDWFRARDGRRALSRISEQLPPLERRIFALVFVNRRTHVEAYELLRASVDASGLGFHDFIAALRSTYAIVSRWRGGALLRELTGLSLVDVSDAVTQPEIDELGERSRWLAEAMNGLDARERAAVQLYVVEELPAADVARMLALPGPKAVYNLVYRALATLRERLEAVGIRKEDL
jgi:RNA polymerase sigma factor (sigma-70 family)